MAVSDVSLLAMDRANDNLYDFIVVTDGSEYLGTVTVKKLLQKSSEIEVTTAKQLNPLTGLPGNMVIEQKLNDLLTSYRDYSAVYIDIDNFKVYNDNYGFEKGDLIIALLANILRELVPANQFIGHIGGDDFVVVFDSLKTEADLAPVVARFETEVLAFYNEHDRQKGYLKAAGRYGTIREFPLAKLTVVVVNNKTQRFTSSAELSATLAELKNQVKQQKTSQI